MMELVDMDLKAAIIHLMKYTKVSKENHKYDKEK